MSIHRPTAVGYLAIASVGVIFTGASSIGGAVQLIRDIIPPLAAASPRLRFHLGRVANNMPVISPTLPAMPDYPTSPYYVVQWNQTSYIEPVLLQRQDRTTYDSRLGKAQFAFEAPDRHSHVSIYPSGQSWIYELYEAGGTLRKTGGSNIFLSSDKMASTATFDHVLNLDFDAKISMASISGSKRAQANGSVLSQVFSGFSLRYIDPQTRQQQAVFMQIPISGSGGPISRHAKFFCTGTRVTLFYPNLTNDEVLLPYASDPGPLRHFHYSLSNYLGDLIFAAPCGVIWPSGATNPGNWSLVGFYIGLETEAADDRSGTSNPPQGVVETGFQLANLTLTEQ